MESNRGLADRRGHLRFDVSGQLWASLDFKESVILRNIASGGALIEARLTPGLRSIRTAQIALREKGPELNVVVRHMAPVSTAPDEDRYLVGVEFVNLSPAVRADLEAFVRQWRQTPGS